METRTQEDLQHGMGKKVDSLSPIDTAGKNEVTGTDRSEV
jgi:hypothetical protein